MVKFFCDRCKKEINAGEAENIVGICLCYRCHKELRSWIRNYRGNIDELSLSERTKNALLRAGIMEVDDLIKFSPSALKELRGMGEGCVSEVVEKLSEAGLALMEDLT